MENPAQIVVNDLEFGITEQEVYELFKEFGNITKLVVKRSTKADHAYAFIDFDQKGSALAARRKLNQEVVGNGRIVISLSDNEAMKQAGGNIYVSNLSLETRGGDLDDYFSEFGEVISSKVIYSKDKSLGYGFVQFKDSAVAQQVVQNPPQKLLHGQTISIEFFRSKIDRLENVMNDAERMKVLYAKGFPASYSSEKLKEIFSEFGVVSNVDVRNASSDESVYAIISFELPDYADAALQRKMGSVDDDGVIWYLNRMMSKAERLHFLRKKYAELADRNLFVTNLPTTLTVSQLEQFFAMYGSIETIKILTSTNIVFREKLEYERIPKGVAFVCYKTVEEANKALGKLKNVVLQDQRIIVRRWIPNHPKRAKAREPSASVPPRPMIPMQPAMMPGVGFPPRGMQRGIPSAGRGRPRATPRVPAAQPAQEPIIDFSRLSSLGPNEQKNYIGECIYNKLMLKYKENTGKITGMLLELPQQQLMAAVHSEEALNTRAEEAFNVLQVHLNQMAK